MSDYNSNYEIAQAISERIGVEPIPFDSVYEICLQIYNELGGEPSEFDSVYEILLGILPLVGGGIASKVIDDSVITTNKTWSSSKINKEIQAVAGIANSDIEGKSTEDFKFVTELPVSGEEGEQVVIKGENADTLYKYVSSAWVEQTPDANKLYFDTENEALYSYVTADQQFAPVSLVNTIVVGSNLNTNAALKAIKTPGVYSVVQRLHSATKGDYIKNWTLTVEGIDYEEYERTDSVYQRIQSNYTIQKRTWSSTRTTNDGWSNFSTYYAGEIKDTITSKYYTWSSSKLNTELGAKQGTLTAGTGISISGDTISCTVQPTPALEAGQNIEIANNKIAAKGYEYNQNLKSFTVNPTTAQNMTSFLPPSVLGLSDVQLSGAANTTTYTYSGADAEAFDSKVDMLISSGVGVSIDGVNYAPIVSADAANHTITLDATLDASNAISNSAIQAFVQVLPVTISGAANTTTYTVSDNSGQDILAAVKEFLSRGLQISVNGYPVTNVTSIDTAGSTITLSQTLSSEAISDVNVLAFIWKMNIASGPGSFAEGAITTASGRGSHAEGEHTTASERGSHAEGYSTTASGEDSHAEGDSTTASGEDSHAEGNITTASGEDSHAEGYRTTASEYASHAEGERTTAKGRGSHAEGNFTTASGEGSHAEGYSTYAVERGSHAEGMETNARNVSEHAEGSYNVSHKSTDNSGNTQHSIGIGVFNARKNAVEVMQNGDMYVLGVGGYQGTKTKVQDATIKTLQEYIASLEARIKALEANTTAK